MGFRAFNATDRFQPNPASTASVMMGCAPVKSYFFPALSSNSEKGTYRHYCNKCDVPSRGPSRHDGQCSGAWVPPKPPDPGARVLVPREELSDGSQRSNDSRHDDSKDIQAYVFVNQYQAIHRGLAQ